MDPVVALEKDACCCCVLSSTSRLCMTVGLLLLVPGSLFSFPFWEARRFRLAAAEAEDGLDPSCQITINKGTCHHWFNKQQSTFGPRLADLG
jgi:hypothetical protein